MNTKHLTACNGLKIANMRTIKFRGLDFFTNQWHYGYLIQVESEGKTYSWIENCGTRISVFTDSVGQFTGLYDKNGKEIYEGDRITHDLGLPEWTDKIWRVVFEFGSFQLRSESSMSPVSFVFHAYTAVKYEAIKSEEEYESHLEITGNIHQTPTP